MQGKHPYGIFEQPLTCNMGPFFYYVIQVGGREGKPKYDTL